MSKLFAIALMALLSAGALPIASGLSTVGGGGSLSPPSTTPSTTCPTGIGSGGGTSSSSTSTNPVPTGGTGASDDYDHDGIRNAVEVQAGSNPFRAASQPNSTDSPGTGSPAEETNAYRNSHLGCSAACGGFPYACTQGVPPASNVASWACNCTASEYGYHQDSPIYAWNAYCSTAFDGSTHSLNWTPCPRPAANGTRTTGYGFNRIGSFAGSTPKEFLATLPCTPDFTDADSDKVPRLAECAARIQ